MCDLLWVLRVALRHVCLYSICLFQLISCFPSAPVCILHAHTQPIARKVLAALLVGLSACVVWSSATIFTAGHPDLSPFSLMIR